MQVSAIGTGSLTDNANGTESLTNTAIDTESSTDTAIYQSATVLLPPAAPKRKVCNSFYILQMTVYHFHV